MRTLTITAALVSLTLHAVAGLVVWTCIQTVRPDPLDEPPEIDTRIVETFILNDEPLPIVLQSPALTPTTPATPPSPTPSTGQPSTTSARNPATRPVIATQKPPATLPPLSPQVKSVVYVLDRSGSMGQFGRLTRAANLLTVHLATLPASTRFGVLAYHSRTAWLTPSGRPNTPGERAASASSLAQLQPEGASAHLEALRSALTQRPDAVVWLTDAADLSPTDDRILRDLLSAARCRLYPVTFPVGEPVHVTSTCLQNQTRSSGSP